MTEMLERVAAALMEMDPSMTPTTEGFSECAVLLASVICGPNEERITAGLGFDPAFVHKIGNRLRAAGIWRQTRIGAPHRKAWSENGGGLAFFLDCGVACGHMVVAGRRKDGPAYSMTDAGRRRVETITRQAT